jgi:hypothetical protein
MPPNSIARYSSLLIANGLIGSMGRRGNPYDKARAESFMKTLKQLEVVHAMAFETFEDVIEHLPTSSRTSATSAGSIRRSAIRSRNAPRINTAGSLANLKPDTCPLPGEYSRSLCQCQSRAMDARARRSGPMCSPLNLLTNSA